MHNVEIRRPRFEDQYELNQLFSTVFKDTFAREGLSDWIEDIKDEIERKRAYLKCDLESAGKNRYFLIAGITDSNKIIGTIEYGPASKLIDHCTKGKLKGLYEIGTVFVLPDYQRRGIGT